MMTHMNIRFVAIALCTTSLLSSLCFVSPARAVDYQTKQPAEESSVNSYRKNLIRLRTQQTPPARQQNNLGTSLPPMPSAQSTQRPSPAPQKKTFSKSLKVKQFTTPLPIPSVQIPSLPVPTEANKTLSFPTDPYKLIDAARERSVISTRKQSEKRSITNRQKSQQIGQIIRTLPERMRQKTSRTIDQRLSAGNSFVTQLRWRINQRQQGIKNKLSNLLEKVGTTAHQAAEQLQKPQPKDIPL